MASTSQQEPLVDQSSPSRPTVTYHSDGTRVPNFPSTSLAAAGTASDPFPSVGEETLPFPEPVSEELPDPPPPDPYVPFDILEAQPRHLFEPGSDLENRRKALVTEARRRWDPTFSSHQGTKPDRLILSTEDAEWYSVVLKLVNTALRPLLRQSQHVSASVDGSDIFIPVQTRDFTTLDNSFETVLQSVNGEFQEEILRLTPLPKFALANRKGKVPFADFVQAAAMYREDVESFLKTHLFAVQSSQNFDHARRHRQRRRTSTGTSSLVDLSGVSTSHISGTSRVASSSVPAIQSGDVTTAAIGNSYQASAPLRGLKDQPPHLSRVERLRLNERMADTSRVSDLTRDMPAGRRMSDLFSPPEFRRGASFDTADPPTPSSTLVDPGMSFRRLRMNREFPGSGRPQSMARNRSSFGRHFPDISEEMEAEAIGETDHPIQPPSFHRRLPGTIATEAELPLLPTALHSRASANPGISLSPLGTGQPRSEARHSPHELRSPNPHSPLSEEGEAILPLQFLRDRFYRELPRPPSQPSQPTEMSHHSRRSTLSRRSQTAIGDEDNRTGTQGRDISFSQASGGTPPSLIGGGDAQPPFRGFGAPDPGDSGGDSSDSNNGRRPGNRRVPRLDGYGRRQRLSSSGTGSLHREVDADGRRIAQFDNKLKPEIIEEWDGDPDTLIKWIESVNILSERSHLVYSQLGEVVPTRLKKRARLWFYGLTNRRRREVMTNWGTLREAIRQHFMNRAWMDRQKRRALEAHYRDRANPKEKPTDYLYRKVELLDTVMDFTDSELIMEVMESAPAFWAQIIDTQRMRDLEDLQDAIKYHEERLEGGGISDSRLSELERLVNQLVNQNSYRKAPKRFFKNESAARAQTTLVGFHASMAPPIRKPDDSNVSPNGRTPESKGARPCRHCGSAKHWDPECRHAKKGNKKARSNHISYPSDYWKAQEAYEDLYYASSTNERENRDSDVENASSDDESDDLDMEGFEPPQA